MTLKNDQFYTKKEVAKICYDIAIKYANKTDSFLEPSAGLGAFFNLLPKDKARGIDIDSPMFIPSVDFLDHDFEETFIIGNLPFGKNSSLAIKFFNHAAKSARVIAFILPRTFRKSSIKNRLDLNFLLAEELILPNDSFENSNNNYSVPTVFQVWIKSPVPREKIQLPTQHKDIIFTTREEANIAFQRVGANAGKISIEGLSKASSSHYFIKASEATISILKSIDWDLIKFDTAGNPSIGKGELIEQYTLILNKPD